MVLCIGITSLIPRGQVSSGSDVLDNISAPINTSTPDFGGSQPSTLPGLQLPTEPLELPSE